jgi:hypothetical protein
VNQPKSTEIGEMRDERINFVDHRCKNQPKSTKDAEKSLKIL